MSRLVLDQQKRIIKHRKQLHGMPHFNQPFSNPLAVGIPVIIDGQIDEIRY